MSQSFVGAGQEPGIELWRIERQLLVKQATVNGKFCTDEVYLVLITFKEKTNSVAHRIHIWCGVDASLSEITVAERKASELSEFFEFNCKPIREEQSAESRLFIDTFKSLGGVKLITKSKIPKSDLESKTKQNSLLLTSQNYGGIRSDAKQSDDTMAQSQKSTSILKRLIKESILAFPTDAHIKVLEFFEASEGLDEERALLLRQCWSKVLLGTQAFGRKTAPGGSIANPDLFADELIRELSYSDRDVARLISLSTHYVNNSDSNNSEGKSMENPKDILRHLQQFNTIDRQLTATRNSIFASQPVSVMAPTDGRSLQTQTSIAMFRNSLKGTRLTFKANKSGSAPSVYCPLGRRLLGQLDLLVGTLVLPKLSSTSHEHASHRDLPLYLSTTELLGVRVTSSQSSTQDLAWSTYQSLNELLVCASLTVFPLPVGVQRDSTVTGSTVFAFEGLHSRPLASLFGPVLSTYLRKHPSVALLWCAQLVTAYHALHDSCSGRLVIPPRLSDMYVRENGLLLLGNLVFSPSSSDNDHSQAEDFLLMAVQLMSGALCLSRCEDVQLRNAADILDDENSVDDEQLLVNDVTLAVVAGSTLELVVTGHNCSHVRVVTQTAEQNSRSQSTSTVRPSVTDSTSKDGQFDASELRVLVEAQQGHTVISHSPSNITPFTQARSTLSNGSVFVHSFSPGVVTLTLSALVDPANSDQHSGEDGEEGHMFSAGPVLSSSNKRGSLSRTSVCTVRVVVVPRYAVSSVALLELIGYLEEYHKNDRSRAAGVPESVDIGPEMVLNAQCCSEISLTKLRDTLAVENSEHQQKGSVGNTNLQREWTEICRAIERLDVKS